MKTPIVWRPFEEAREYARALKLKNNVEWRSYCTSEQKPDDIPSTPDRVYRSEWTSWGDFLGTGNIATKKRVYLSFEEAREYIRSLGFKNRLDWLIYCLLGQKPDNITANPNATYKSEWTSWGDFLGTGNIAYKDKERRSFEEAREYIRSLGLKNQKEWQAYSKSGERPSDIPSNPGQFYVSEWNGYRDWLGIRKTSRWLPFDEARAYVHSLGLQSQREWYVYALTKQRQKNIPANPHQTYKGEFKGYGDWLGNGNITLSVDQCRPFEEARKYVRSLGLKGWKSWYNYCKSGEKPHDIPYNPFKVYRGVWIGMCDWLGATKIGQPWYV